MKPTARSPRWTTTLGAGLLAGLMLVPAACDEALIEPFENEDRFFTVYGYLDQLETTHLARVIPVMKFPERIASPDDPQATLDAEVTTTDLTTGATRRWTHALERLRDGTYAHLFRARDYTVLPGHTYRLEVRRSDGTTASAETTVPDFSALPPPALDPVQVTEGTRLTQQVRLPGLASPWDIRVRYHIPTGLRTTRVAVPYGRAGERTADGGWRFTINLSEDAAFVRDAIATDFPDQDSVVLAGMSLLIRVLDEQWDPPAGVFDPEVLAQPGTLSNVENGYGFFGSIGVYFPEWPVDRSLGRQLGFD